VCRPLLPFRPHPQPRPRHQIQHHLRRQPAFLRWKYVMWLSLTNTQFNHLLKRGLNELSLKVNYMIWHAPCSNNHGVGAF
jgi:hypothetical protein